MRSRALHRHRCTPGIFLISLTILAGGLLISVQGRTRIGWRHLGVGGSGALDAFSFAVANLLAGNVADAATIEITLAGPRLHFDDAARIAICVAEIDASVD